MNVLQKVFITRVQILCRNVYNRDLVLEIAPVVSTFQKFCTRHVKISAVYAYCNWGGNGYYLNWSRDIRVKHTSSPFHYLPSCSLLNRIRIWYFYNSWRFSELSNFRPTQPSAVTLTRPQILRRRQPAGANSFITPCSLIPAQIDGNKKIPLITSLQSVVLNGRK